jgi:hypothetical protein
VSENTAIKRIFEFRERHKKQGKEVRNGKRNEKEGHDIFVKSVDWLM